MFSQNKQNEWEFLFGKDSEEKAAEAAASCHFFQEDDEDEQVSDVNQSCYNCRYRRWTMTSFLCKKINLT